MGHPLVRCTERIEDAFTFGPSVGRKKKKAALARGLLALS